MGIDADDLRTCLEVLARVDELPLEHPDAVAVRRATARIFKSVKERRRAARRAAVSAEDRAVLAGTATAAPGRIDDETSGVELVGMYIALRLLRDGADTTITTRFPKDAEALPHAPHVRTLGAAHDLHPGTALALTAHRALDAGGLLPDEVDHTSVDTGWITDERPHTIRRRLADEGFHAPLDLADGDARVYDPIVRGEAGEDLHGVFLKDYAPTRW